MSTVKFKESIMTDNVVVEVTTREEVDALCDFLVSKGQEWDEDTREELELKYYICPRMDDVYPKNGAPEGYRIISFAEALQDEDSTLLRVKAKESVRRLDELFTVDTLPKLPEWLLGLSNKSLRDNPVLVYCSGISEEDAIKYGGIGLLFHVDINDNNYPFKLVDTIIDINRSNFKSHDELLESEELQETIEDWGGSIGDATYYNFAVPVRSSDWVVEDEKNNKLDNSTEQQLANTISESLASLDKEKLEIVLETLTKMHSKM